MRVGHVAREKMILQPDRAIYASKRFIGRPYASREVKAMAHFYNYAVVPSDSGGVAAKVEDRTLSLEQVASLILAFLRRAASDALGETVQRAVVTVPASFGETQRQAVREAGRLAGIYVERVLNEPSAAAVAYGAGRGFKKTVLVYNLGGGTFDASLLRLNGDHMEVLASDGDAFLGGSDFDDRLTEWLLARFERDTGVNLRDQPVAVQRVRFAAESAKVELSSAASARVVVPFLTQTDWDRSISPLRSRATGSISSRRISSSARTSSCSACSTRPASRPPRSMTWCSWAVSRARRPWVARSPSASGECRASRCIRTKPSRSERRS